MKDPVATQCYVRAMKSHGAGDIEIFGIYYFAQHWKSLDRQLDKDSFSVYGIMKILDSERLAERSQWVLIPSARRSIIVLMPHSLMIGHANL